jgi:outer membrane protein assembly factor BamB
VNGGVAQACGLSGATYTCNVSTTLAPANAHTPAYGFVITAKDSVGNPTAQAGSLQVDTRAPAVTVTADTKWYARGGNAIVTFTAVDDAGSGLSGLPTLETVDTTNTQTAKTYTAVLTGPNTYQVQVKPVDFLKTGVQVAAYALRISARDAAGNITRSDLTRAFDDLGPSIAVTADTGVYGRTAPITVTATIADAGSGLALAAPTLTATDLQATTQKVYTGVAGTGGSFTFTLNPSEFMPAGKTVSAFGFRINAADAVGNATSQSLTRTLDDEAPVIAVTPDTGWYARSGSLTVNATITDAGGLGTNVPSLDTTDSANTTTPAHVVGSGSGTAFSFALSPSDFLKANVTVPAYAFRVTVRDAAGNTATADLTRAFDGETPVITVTPDTSWHARAGTFNVTATIADAGAGLASAAPTLTATDPAATTAKTYTGTGTGGTYTFTVTPSDFMPGGQTYGAFALRISASDAVTNTATAPVTARLDDEAPAITVTADSAWYGKAASVVVNATVTDSGAGLGSNVPTLETNDVNGTQTAKTYAATANGTNAWKWTFTPSDFIKTGLTLNSFGLRVRAKDTLNNASLSDTARSFDDQAPVISYTTPGTALLRNATSTPLTATITDQGTNGAGQSVTGAGVSAASAFLSYTKKDGSTANVAATTASGSTYTFNFDASDPQFNASAGPVTITFKAADAAGNNATKAGSVNVTRKLWEFDSGSGAKVNGSVAYQAGKVYFSANANGAFTDNLFAVNAADGARIWSAKVAGTPTSPVTVGSDHLYLAADDGGGTIHAFPTTQAASVGVEGWSCILGGVAYGALGYQTAQWSGVTGVSDTVISAVTGNAIFAARKNGSSCTMKVGATGADDVSLSTVSLASGSLFVGSDAGRLLKAIPVFTAATLFGSYAAGTSPSGFGPFALAGAAISNASKLEYAHPNSLVESSMAMSGEVKFALTGFTKRVNAPPTLISDTSVWFASDDGKLFGIDTTAPASPVTFAVTSGTGTPLPIRTSPTIGMQKGSTTTRTLYFGANDGKIHAVSTGGLELWSYDATTSAAGTLIDASSALTCAGILYTGTTKGKIIALVTDSTDGLGDSAWPRYQHDNRNTGNLATPLVSGGTCQD